VELQRLENYRTRRASRQGRKLLIGPRWKPGKYSNRNQPIVREYFPILPPLPAARLSFGHEREAKSSLQAEKSGAQLASSATGTSAARLDRRTARSKPFPRSTIMRSARLFLKYVVVPADALEVKDGKMLLRGASKDQLKALPAFTYAK
jgi:hypothetical protein